MPESLVQVWLARPAYIRVLQFASASSIWETGGVLMGYHGANGEIVVTNVIGPGPGATHRLFSFIPDHDFQEKEIALAYTSSNRTLTYLGDWHTHPLGGTEPSAKDLRTARKISKCAEARLLQPLMAIISGLRNRQIKFWRYSAAERRLLPAMFVVYEAA